MIKFTNLTKAFGDHTVLNDISVQIYEGQTTVIVGSSGSGKSTLLRCINLLEIPQKGELELGGQRLNFANKISQKELLSFRRHTGMVFQSFNLFPHLTVLQNVIEGPTQVLGIDKQSAINKARELLNKVGLSQKENAYPNRLSGGQCQRTAIARALAMDPAFLLLDEPTSALDPELGAEVFKVVIALAKEKKSLVIVTHNMNFTRKVADRILFLNEGKIAFDGGAEEFFGSDSPRIVKFISAMDT
ncbi:amino acid ABC transporter ATP-binding protein [uncultured Campylobacter sp.]|uniref:amino acid ABC transporter ATP-binding protein n=1 Tax=uncultured Campylobacter sp. TaxID=218934 RepID=UPI003211B1C9